ALAEMDAGELAVSIGQLVADRPVRLRPSTPDFGTRELKAIRLLDAHSVLRACDGIHNGGAAHLQHPFDSRACRAAVDVELKLDIRDDRLVQQVARRAKDLEHRRPRLGILTLQDADQSVALLRYRAPVDDLQSFALAFMDRARPAKDRRRTQAV